MTYLNLSLLGPPRIEIDGRSHELATRKATALLVYLAVTEQAHSRDALAAMLWPESDTSRAKASLRRALSDIKKALGGDWLTAEPHLICINETTVFNTDVHEFRRLLTAVSSPAALAQAVALYRADFLNGFTLPDAPAFDEWQFFEQEALRQELALSLDTLINHHMDDANAEAAILYGQRLVALDPLNEQAHVQLMHSYTKSGQKTAALRQYHTCQSTLKQELGIEPATATTTLYHQIKDGRLHPQAAPPPAPDKHEPRHNLPERVTSFIGRGDELSQIAVMLDDANVRLLTLIGLGGIGKTRLALEVVQDKIDQFAAGVWYIDLVPVRSTHGLLTAVANALNFTFRGTEEPQQQLVTHIHHQPMLWLLDNVEHLLPDCADLISTLLRQSPLLKIMATSRTMLDLAEEWIYAVKGLPYPPARQSPLTPANPQLPSGMQYAAVQLFSQRARQARHDFSLPEEEAHVIEICRLVAGMPLALELAAAWVRMLPTRQIAAEVARSLDLLMTNNHNVSDRHRSIRAVFDYSWQMLSSLEQTTLAKLSVFQSNFTTEAAQEVTDATLFTLYGLLNKSLLHTDANGRYQMHELLRQFAAEKLAQRPPEEADTEERHTAYYTGFLHRHEKELFGAQQTAVIDNINREIENVYQAWLWAAQNGRFQHLGHAMHSLYSYHAMRSLYQQGQRLFSQTITLLEPFTAVTSQEANALLAQLMVRQGEYLYTLGKLSAANDTLHQALSLAQQMQMKNEMQLATQTLGVISYLQGDYAAAKELLAQALATAVDLKDNHRQAYILMTTGAVEQALGNYAQAQQCHQSSLHTYQTLNYQWGIAHSLRFLGITAHRLGDYDSAQTYHQQSLTIYQAINNETGIALALNNLGLVAQAQGHPEDAQQLYQQGLALGIESRANLVQANALKNLGHSMSASAQPQQGSAYLRRALELAIKTEATPLVLEIMLDIAQQLESIGHADRALTLANFIQQHPASSWETQNQASQIQAQLSHATPTQPHIEDQTDTLQQMLSELIDLPATG